MSLAVVYSRAQDGVAAPLMVDRTLSRQAAFRTRPSGESLCVLARRHVAESRGHACCSRSSTMRRFTNVVETRTSPRRARPRGNVQIEAFDAGVPVGLVRLRWRD